LGSGGGLPGLVLAEQHLDLHFTLLDGRTQRIERLKSAVETLGWSSRVDVVAARAEEAGRDRELRAMFDVVVARGFSSPGVTAECAAPLLRVGGILIVSEPPEAPPRWPTSGCAQVGLVLESLCESPWSFSLLRQVEPCPDRFPRRVGIPGKRPLF
jgi:16S rRNA (guanine527-N7)-methyltransferase